MAKKPKENWQIEVRAKLDSMGIGYRELSEFMNENEGSIRQVMCKDNQPILRSKICNYLNIEIEETENEQNQNL